MVSEGSTTRNRTLVLGPRRGVGFYRGGDARPAGRAADVRILAAGGRGGLPLGRARGEGSRQGLRLPRPRRAAGPRLITVKLAESHGHALAIDGAEPTGYGLGR